MPHADSNRLGAGEFCCLLCELTVIRHPRIRCVKVPLNAELSPVVQFLLDKRGRGLWLQAKRMPAEINANSPVFCLWKMKSVAELCEGIATIHIDRKGLTGLESPLA